jgi:hypothetical protein
MLGEQHLTLPCVDGSIIHGPERHVGGAGPRSRACRARRSARARRAAATAAGGEPAASATDHPNKLRAPTFHQLSSESDALVRALEAAGGRIVTEVLIGIIDADPGSYRSRQPDWTPPLPARGERFGLADMLIPLAKH